LELSEFVLQPSLGPLTVQSTFRSSCEIDNGDFATATPAFERALCLLGQPFEIGVQGITPSQNGEVAEDSLNPNRLPIRVRVPAYPLENLGDASFRADHGLRLAYVAGAMANGIGSAEIVEAMARAGLLSFFGSAGLTLPAVEAAIDRLTANLDGMPFGFNLIHSPNESALEAAVVELYLKRGIRLVEASAYLDLTLPIVRFRVQGIRRDSAGRIITPNRVIAKVSRVEVASKFMAPPPLPILQELVSRAHITRDQAELASRIPMAQDVTAEADSGGHTDNRPSITLIPTMLALRDRMQDQYRYTQSLRVGAAGGISTPASAAAAFSMGAAYILTGSVNQSCREAGTSDVVRQMLAQAEQADTMMAPAADMFEMGVKVQVLKRGTMFPMRAAKLYELYRTVGSVEELPAGERSQLEKTIFRAPIEEIWVQTRDFFRQRDPSQIERAERDPKHKLALVFRWYLGQSSRWAKSGEASRKIDYQIWCGPAMGAFNEWAKGSFLERPENRRVTTVAMNILYGTAVMLRANHMRCQGVHLPADFPRVRPLELEEIRGRLS
jgi:PfaD family protein